MKLYGALDIVAACSVQLFLAHPFVYGYNENATCAALLTF